MCGILVLSCRNKASVADRNNPQTAKLWSHTFFLQFTGSKLEAWRRVQLVETVPLIFPNPQAYRTVNRLDETVDARDLFCERTSGACTNNDWLYFTK